MASQGGTGVRNIKVVSAFVTTVGNIDAHPPLGWSPEGPVTRPGPQVCVIVMYGYLDGAKPATEVAVLDQRRKGPANPLTPEVFPGHVFAMGSRASGHQTPPWVRELEKHSRANAG